MTEAQEKICDGVCRRSEPTGSAQTETEKELEYFKRYVNELEEECRRLRELIPTTAQVMVYHSLLMQYQKLEKQLAENK